MTGRRKRKSRPRGPMPPADPREADDAKGMRDSAWPRRAGENPGIAMRRWALLRALRTAEGDHLSCEAVCRRARRCAGPTMRCLANLPAETLSPEEAAIANAKVSAILREVLDEAARRRAISERARAERAARRGPSGLMR